MERRPYHLAIIGVRFPQLALATLLAKRGRRVLILEERHGVPPQSEEHIEGHLFRKRPAPLFGLDEEGVLRRLLDEVGIGHLLVRDSYPQNPVSYQVVLPRHRVSVFPGREALAGELSREFPAQAGAFADFYRECDRLADTWYRGFTEVGPLEGRSPYTWAHLRGRLSVLRDARRLAGPARFGLDAGEPGRFLALQQHFLASYPLGPAIGPSPGGIPPLALALTHAIGRRGTFAEPEGTASLASLLITRFLEYGGAIEFGVKVEAVEGWTPRGGFPIRLAGGEKRFARVLATTESLGEKLGVRARPLRPAAGGPAPLVPQRFYMGIRDRIVPLGMADNLFLLREDGGGPLGIRALYLALSPRGSRMAPAGSRSLTVTALVPPGLLASSPKVEEQAVLDDLVAALGEVIPFLDEGLTLARSDLSAVGRETPPRTLGQGVTVWSPALVGRSRVRAAARGRALLFSSPPWELGLEGEALMTLAAAGLAGRAAGEP
jgi:phytoene dehydrogenase-like protein